MKKVINWQDFKNHCNDQCGNQCNQQFRHWMMAHNQDPCWVEIGNYHFDSFETEFECSEFWGIEQYRKITVSNDRIWM